MYFNPWTYLTGLRLCFCLLMGFCQFPSLLSQTSDCVFSLEIEWQKHFGGSNSEILQNSRALSDGGYIMGGHSLSDDGDVVENYGGVDYWILKTDQNGNALWNRNLGGASTDIGNSVVETTDRGLLFAGSTLSNDEDVSSPLGSYDVWIMKLDQNGNSLWDRSYGGTGNDRPEWIENTPDGGIVICGTTSSFDGDINENKGISDAMVIKLDQAGNVQWSRTVGGSSEDFANHIQTTSDGGYIVCGGTFSFEGDIQINNGIADALVFKLDSNGNVEWVRTLGGSGVEWANWNIQTQDGGYLLTGPTDSKDGDFAKNNGGRDLWILKLDASGNTLWRQVYGGSKDDLGNAIVETDINGFLIGGHSEVSSGDVSNNYGNLDVWVLNCDENGFLIQDYNFGGSNSEMTEDFRFTNDGGLILSGFSESNDFDLDSNNGQADFWAIKFKPLSSGLSNPDLGPDQEICEAENILLDANVTGCVNCSFLWSDGNMSPARIVNVTETSSYSVVITDETGCSVTDEILISLSDLELNISFEHPSGCIDDGMITVEAIGGTGNYSYSWSNDVFDAVNANLTAGIYRVTVSDGICTKDQLVLLQPQNANFPQVELGDDQTICNNASISLEVAEDLTANWSTGETGNSIEISIPGYYTVTVTNADGCTAIDAININGADEIFIDLGEDLSTCESELLISTNLSAIEFIWSNGSTENEIVVSESGIYEVTVTDAFGCTNSDQIEAEFLEGINLDLGADLTSCGPIELISPIEGLNYSWNNGSTDRQIQAEQSGNYELLVTDANGCTAIDEIFVEIFESPNVDLGESLNTCESEIIIATNLNGLDFIWSTGSTENQIVVNESGFYEVTVTNEFGCTSSDQTEALFFESLDLDLGLDQSSCGPIQLMSPLEGLTYSWSNGSTTSETQVDQSGIYELIVTDSNGCTARDEIGIEIFESPNAELGENLVSCESIGVSLFLEEEEALWSTGSTENRITVEATDWYWVTVTNSAGCQSVDSIYVEILNADFIDIESSYTSCQSVIFDYSNTELDFIWSNGSNESILEISESGFYSITVTNDMGCSSIEEFTVEIVEELTLELGEDISSCEEIILNTGQSGLNYLWSNGEASNEIIISESGLYAVTITDDSGCSAEDEINVEIFEELDVDLGADITSCSAVLLETQISGLSYLWSTGSTEASIEVTESGFYILEVRTADGCITSDSIMVEIVDEIPLDLGADILSCESIILNAGLDGTNLTYNWSNGDTESETNIAESGTYALTITDINGCSAMDEIVVEIQTPLVFDLGEDLTECGSVLVSANVDAASYLWSNGSTEAATEVENSGTLSLTIITDAGCESKDSIEVNITDGFELTIDLVEPDCYGENTASIDLEVSNAVGELEFNWADGFDEAIREDLAPGSYEVSIVDETGCQQIRTIEINDPEEIQIELISLIHIACDNATGSILVETSGGTGSLELEWSSLSGQSEELNTEQAGVYSLIVTDQNGCSASAEYEILKNVQLEAETQMVSEIDCYGNANASVNINVLSGIEPYSFEWQNSSTGSMNSGTESLLTELAAGDYLVTVQDASDCETVIEFSVTEPDAIELFINAYGSCGDFGYAVANISGGLEPFEYDWDNGDDSALISQLSDGIYTLTITDAMGCTQVQETEISNFEEVIFEATNTDLRCFGEEDAFISIDVIQGAAPFQYDWNNGATSPDITNLGGGAYTVFVTDANGCTTAGTIDVLEPNEIGLQANTIGSQSGNNGSIDLLPYGGIAPYTYLWEDGSTSSMRSDLENGTYYVTITDQNDCQIEEAIELFYTVTTQELILEELSISPNPTNGILLINGKHHLGEKLDLEIYNSIGQCIYSAKDLGQSISLDVDLSTFSSGVYFVRLKSGSKTTIAKPIVKM